jgi:Transposase DDE domain group 1
LKVKPTARLETVEVTADGEGLVSHAGSALLAELADRSGLTEALSEALWATRERRSAHDPGRVVRDLALMLCDGGDRDSDLVALRGQGSLFGPVASETTAHRVIKSIEPGLLDASNIPSRGASLHEASTGVQAIHPSGHSPRLWPPGWNGPPLGFPPSSAPRRPGADNARRGGDRPSSTGLELRAQHHISRSSSPCSSLTTCDIASHDDMQASRVTPRSLLDVAQSDSGA